MPYKRRRYGSKRLSRPTYYYAKLLDTAYKQQEASKRLTAIQTIAGTANNMVQFYNPATGTYAPISQETAIGNLAARGKGSYGFGRIGRALGGLAGAALGSRAAGAAVGGFIGRTGSNALFGSGGYVSGSGSYGMPTNSLISGSSVAVPTMMGGDEIGSICVSHKEYLGNITGSISFENSAFQLNPGLSSTFPWLSQIAQNYEEYTFNQLMFTYTSLLSDSTASGVIGSIIMTTNYNAGQPDFTTSADMLNNIGTVSARPIDGPIIHGIECDDTKNVMSSYFVRSGAVPDNQDIKTYDMGRYQIATEGMPEDNQLQGQLWVSYNIVLRKPKIFTAAGKGIGCDLYKMLTTVGNNRKYMIGKTLLASPLNNIGTKITCPDEMSYQVNFPSTTVNGYFKISISWLNPTDDDGFPNQPKMWPFWTYSNCQIASPQIYANYVVEETDTGSNCVFQTGTYTLGSQQFDPQIRIEVIIKLLGSFAIPTYLLTQFPEYGEQSFKSTDVQIIVEQINPQFVAPTPDNPANWVPIVTTN